MNRIGNRLLIGGLVLGATSLHCLADYPAEVLGLGPINYWQLNETGPVPSGVVLANLGSLGSAANGSLVGSALLGVTGVLPGHTAMQVSGNARAVVPYNVSMNSPTFSAEGWFKPDAGSIGNTQCIFSQFVEGTRSGWLVYQVAGGWSFRLYNQNGTSTSLNVTATTSAIAPVAGQWFHIAVTFDGSTGKLYVNGVPFSGTATGFVPNVSNPFAIGARADVAFGWSGTAAEVALYSSALSADTVVAHYSAATTNASGYAAQIVAASPIGYYRLDQAPYTALTAVNTGSRGALANGSYYPAISIEPGMRPPTYPPFGAANTAPVFDGASGFIDCGTNSSLAGPTDFSIAAWVKTLQTTTGVIIQQRMPDAGGVAGYDGEYMVTMNADGTVQFFLYKGGYQFNYATTTPINDGNWHFVVAERQGVNGNTYIDGNLAGSAAGTAVLDLVPAIKTFIGRDQRDFINGFAGAISSVAMFDHALNQGSIQSLYYTAIGSSVAPTVLSDPPVVTPSGDIYATLPFSIRSDIAGTLPMTYQWLKDGVLVGTNRDFNKASATVSDSGLYKVVATNPFGTATSSTVLVTINPAVPASVEVGPVTRSVYPGGAARFSVTAAGTAPISYQWKHAGTNLPGATNSVLIVTNCAAAQTGAYTVGVANVAGGAVSAAANLSLLTPVAGSYVEKMVTNGAIAFWRFNESSGPTAFDYAGGYDGTISNAVAQAMPGPRPPTFAGLEAGNNAYGYNGTDASVQGPSLGLAGSFSVSAWVYPNALNTDRAITGEYGSWALKLNGSEIRFTTPGILDHQTSGAGVTAGNWHHVAVTFSPSAADGCKFYLDGALVGTTAASTLTKGTLAFWTGNNQWGGQDFDGSIDEVAVYNKILTGDTIASIYASATYGSSTAPFVVANPAGQTVVVGGRVALQADVRGSQPVVYQWVKDGVAVAGATTSTLTINSVYFTDAGSYVLWATNGVGRTNTAAAALVVMPPPTFANQTNNLVLHLRFDGTYTDTSGRGNDAYAINGSPAFIGGEVGQGVRIATSPGTAYLQVGDVQNDLQFDETASFTVGFWVRYTAGFNDQPIIGNAINSTWQLGWVFTDSAQAGKLEWSLVSAAGSGTYLRDPVGTNVIGDGNWHNVVGVVDRQQQVASAYVDGNLAGSWSIVGLGTLNTYQMITIGQDPTGNYGTATFDLDDVGIWRRALNPYEAASVYGAAQRSGASFDTFGPVLVWVNMVGANIDVSWQAGTLMQSTSASGPWTPVPGATAPFYRTTAAGSAKFFRVKL